MMEEITANYKRIADANERRAIAQERQAELLHGIAINLGVANLPEKKQTVEESPDPSPIPELKAVNAESPGSINSTEFDREKILSTILEMRKNKKSYGKIAQYLRSKNVPTFSGRGTWHGQTVSRLCD